MENQKNQYNEIMELKKAKEELKESEDKYKHIVEFAPTGIYEIDYKGPSFKSVNDAMCQITGYKREELMKMSPFDLLSDESKKIFQKRIQKILNGEKIDENVDFQVITKDGHEIWANLNVKLIYKDGKLDGALVVAHDITEHKSAEIALHESEKRYRQFFNNPLNGFALCKIITDDNDEPVDFVYLEVNKTFEDLTGLKKEDVINKKVTDIFPFEEVAKLIQIYGKVALTGEQNIFEYPIPSLDKIYEVAAFSPQKKCFIAFFTDITERKKAEDMLHESEELYRGVVENTTAIILRINLQGIIQFANERALNFFGYSEDELIGKHAVGTIVPETDTAGRDLAKMVDEIAEDPDSFHSNENENIRKNGERVWMEWTNSGIYDKDGNLKEFLSVGINATERKKAEKALKNVHDNLKLKVKERTEELEEAYNALSESEEKFREIFNQANDMITLVELGENGLPGRFLDVNDVAPKRLGYSKEEFSKMSTKDIIAPEYRFQMAENAKNLMKNKHARFEIINVDKWGTKIPVEVSIHIFKLREKDVILAISHDIRERKQAEEELNKLLEELKRSNDELQQFAYISSHDLQEPLRTIASFTQLLERRYKGRLDSDADEFMDYIVDAAKRMKEQIEGLLEFSRVGTKGVEFELVDMNLILNQTIQNLNLSIRETDAEITYEELPTVMGDSRQLQRVFQNLISNAIKFRKQDESPKIHISCQRDEDKNEYVFSVSDNGIGIEEQYFERIFTIFQQLHARKEYTGTGIGLAIVKRIIDRHRGHIWVKSEFGVGSTFYFTIPVEPVDIIEQKI